VPALPEPLAPASIVDISHESLMRVWTRLDGWADDEAQSMRIYRRLREAAALYDVGQTNLWRDPDLRLALDWRRHAEPTEAWADQYGGHFARAMAFLDDSRDAQQAARIEADIERRWLAGWSYVPLALAALLFLVLQPHAANWRWPFSVVLNLAADLGAHWRDWLLDATWIPSLLAGTPAAVAYLMLVPYARRLFGRAALARIARDARAGLEWRDPAESTGAAAAEVHATTYAGFWRRAAASLVDWALCLAAVLAAWYLVFALLADRVGEGVLVIAAVLAALPVFLLYHVLSWTSRQQATPGMRLAGIFLTDLGGRPIGWLRAIGRHGARFLSYYTAGLGFLVQPWDDRRQALHDRLSGTVVLRRPSVDPPGRG
jgi:uncharacterized RDD family membrane protein YckC